VHDADMAKAAPLSDLTTLSHSEKDVLIVALSSLGNIPKSHSENGERRHRFFKTGLPSFDPSAGAI
jgi:hypothetical protein